MTQSDKFSCWLLAQRSESADKQYRHCLLKEDLGHRSEILEDLTAYVQSAHEDARCRLRKLAGISLAPSGCAAPDDPAQGYPERLHIRTLKGYFGEVLAGLFVEHFSPFGLDNWQVPAFLFRFHSLAFDQLELWRQTDKEPGIIPGRTGHDCLAFQRDGDGRILRSLICEAKCTKDHSSNLISEAHETVSEANLKPIEILRLIEILQDCVNHDSDQWVESLRNLYFQDAESEYERCDLVSYVCGRSPVRDSRTAWVPTETPHTKYTASRRLEVVEAHLHDVEILICQVYAKKEIRDDSTK